MRQSYLKNAALMTGADVLLRLAGMGLRIYLANALGGEGMGLYQLVLAVYALFVKQATAGVSVAATRLMAEELSRGRAEARGMLVRLLAAGLGLGAFAMVAQFGLAGLAAAWWLGDARAAGALRAAAFGMPWMAVSAALRGFFIAQRAQPAGGTDRPHRGRLCGVGAGDLTGLGERPKVHRGAGGHGPERGSLGLYDAPVLPPGGPALLCRGKGPAPP